jgi:hypothetical protein
MATTMAGKGVEVAGNLTGKALVSLATFLLAAANAQTRSRGRTRIRSFQGKPTKVFVIRQKDLPQFAKQAREYGVLYAAIVSRKDKSPNGLVDVVVNANDAAKVNRIAERFAISAVEQNHASVSEEAIKGEAFSIGEEALAAVLGEDAPKAQESANPKTARQERATPSAPISKSNRNIEAISERPSIRAQVLEIRQSRQNANRQPQPQRGLAPKAPPPRGGR